MDEKTPLELCFDEGEAIIADIMTNGITLERQRALIQVKTKFILEIGNSRKSLQDKRLAQKTKEMTEVKYLMDQGVKKTPAREEVEEKSRGDRYDLEKLGIDMETMQNIAMNRNYHLRINEIDVNKV